MRKISFEALESRSLASADLPVNVLVNPFDPSIGVVAPYPVHYGVMSGATVIGQSVPLPVDISPNGTYTLTTNITLEPTLINPPIYPVEPPK